MNTTADIIVPKVNVALLRRQRDQLLNWMALGDKIADSQDEIDLMDGVVDMLDEMLDIAER